MYRSLEKELLSWKMNPLRYPLLLRGARQVGKTYLIEAFGKAQFDSIVSVNFEAEPQAIACFESLEPVQILHRLERILGQPIYPGKTLLFLDEIQACPQAIVALRYFKEKMPLLHVIGAGSLLEFAFVEGKFSFPVGRVQFLYLKPLSFQEFVMSRGRADLLSDSYTIQNPPEEQVHRELLQLVKEYFLVGGMPAVVSRFLTEMSMQNCAEIQNILLATYRADFSKYATEAECRSLRILFDGLSQTIGQQFKYSKIDAHIRSRELKNGLDQLEWAGLIQTIYASSAAGIPLAAQAKRSHFKLLFLDIGLLQRSLQVDPEVVWKDDPLQINSGALAEQYVGQELLAYADPRSDEKLYFWQREKTGSDAEVDYLLAIGRNIIPIEVKSGPKGKLKSLHQFMQEKDSKLGVRISTAPLSFNNKILSLPLYFIDRLQGYVQTLL